MAFINGHALVIGVGSYGPNPPLSASGDEKRPGDVPITTADAEAVVAILTDPRYCGYPTKQVKLLHDGEATRERILAELDRLAATTGPDDTVFVFYAGHGEYDAEQHFCLTTNDTRLDKDHKVIAKSGVREDELLRRIKQIPARRALLVFNSCHAGDLSPDALGGSAAPPTDSGKALPEALATALLGTGQGRVLIAACRQDEKSYFRRSDTRTFFGAALAEGLEGVGVPNRRGYISVFDLYEHVYTTVSTRAKQLLDVVQQPELTISKGVGVMAVALHRGATPATALNDADVPGSLGGTGVVREVESAESSRLLEAILSGALRLGAQTITKQSDNISVGNITGSSGVAIGRGASSTVRNVNTGGGDYAERDIDKRTGTFVQGDQFTMSGNFSGAILNIKSNLKNVSQSIGAAPHGDAATKAQLQALIEQLTAELEKAPSDKESDAEAVAETAKQAVEQATKATPNKTLVQISVEGLKQAAQHLAAALPAVLPLATKIAEALKRFVQ